MFWSVFFGVLTAAFAVFGLVCAIQLLVERMFPLEQLRMAVELHGNEDAEDLELLLREARSASCLRRGGRLVVLLPEELTDPELQPVLLQRVIHWLEEGNFRSVQDDIFELLI